MFRFRQTLALGLAWLALVVAGSALAQDANYDPPARVGRLAYVAGDVSIAPNGSNTWSRADRNRPLVAGDRLWSGSDGRAAIDLGGGAVRADRDTAFDFAALDDQTLRVVLSQGTLNLSVRRLFQGQSYEVDTPTLAFVPAEQGSYRIDVAPDGNGAMVTVFSGSGTAWGANDSRRDLEAGYSYRFDDVDLRRMSRNDIPYGNDFDRFCADLDSEYNRSQSARYVADNVVGYDDLDRYGSWTETTDYGPVWYPTTVATDWAPYRFGHWAWIAPWGWTWIDDSAWGFAPFHYGRWALIGARWGWIPGPRLRRAVYAPALVVFTGNTLVSVNGPVGWFPLGPRDVYLPPYRVSRSYFVGINLAGGRFFDRGYIGGMYADYRNPHYHGPRDYAYRYTPRAVTRVPHDIFTGARPVAPANERASIGSLQRAPVLLAPTARPVAASYAATPRGAPPRAATAAFTRDVVTRVPVGTTGGVPRAMPDGNHAPMATRIVRQPTLPTSGIGVATPSQEPVATLPRARPADHGGMVPTAPSRAIEREQPMRGEPMTSTPTRSVYTPRATPRQEPAPRDTPTAAPSWPRPVEREQPIRRETMNSEPTRSVYTPRAMPRPEPQPRSFEPTPRNFEPAPRSEPMQPVRSMPVVQPMPRAEPVPQRTEIQSAPARESHHESNRHPAAGGLTPRGRPEGY